MKEHMAIATEIQRQLNWEGKAVVWSWGAREYMAMPETKRFGDYMLAGLKFRVSGRLFKGNVIVWLTAADTYTVELGNFSRKKMEFVTKKKVENVYCDELAYTVDRLVETPEN